MTKNAAFFKTTLWCVMLLLCASALPAQLVYKSGYTAVTGFWDENGTLQQVLNENPYEGGQHYRFTYNISDYWSGFGLNMSMWYQFPGVNLSAATHLRIAYRGLNPGQSLRITLRTGDTIFGQEVEIGGPQPVYQTVDIPLANLTGNTMLNLAAISEMVFAVVDDGGQGTGTVYIDAIEGVVLAPPPPSVAWSRWEKLGRGMNLNNWLEAYWLLPWNAYPEVNRFTRADIEFFHKAGIQSLRLPITVEHLAENQPPYAVNFNHTAFALVDSAIAWADTWGLNLIIDNHHGTPTLTNANYVQQIPRLCAIWRQLAQRYQHLNPERFFFELYNEPTTEISNNNFKYVARAIIDTVRQYAPDHTLIIGATAWNSGGALTAIEPYYDPNVIYTFHNYDPYFFTHQGFSWSGLPTGVPFPQGNDAGALENVFEGVKQWSEFWDVPVTLGEFGVSAFADPDCRCAWIDTLGGLIDRYQFPDFYWDMKYWDDSFGFFRGSVLHPDSAVACFTDALHLDVSPAVNLQQPSASCKSLQVYPNPATDRTAVALTLAEARSVRIQLFNASGFLLNTWQYALPSGSHVLTLPLLQCNKGIHWIAINDGQRSQTVKLYRE